MGYVLIQLKRLKLILKRNIINAINTEDDFSRVQTNIIYSNMLNDHFYDEIYWPKHNVYFGKSIIYKS